MAGPFARCFAEEDRTVLHEKAGLNSAVFFALPALLPDQRQRPWPPKYVKPRPMDTGGPT